MSTPAGWYDAPDDPRMQRWWDGSQWTTHTQPKSMALSSQPNTNQQHVGEADLERRIEVLKAEITQLESRLVHSSNALMLQEIGVYEYSHPLDSSVKFQVELEKVETEQKVLIKEDRAVTGTSKWAINGSDKEGAKMIGDLKKLMLRTYNNEADTLVRAMKPYGLDTAKDRLVKCRDTIAKLGVSMKLAVNDEYHKLRLKELALTADYLNKVAEEKELEREERSRLKEEEKAVRELELANEKLEKERAHYQAALVTLIAKGDTEAVARAESKLSEIVSAIAGVQERAANIRAGYVYVISNIGAFGRAVCKIGLTRRLDPLDRVRELGDASVPFRFDVHALIFSSDAVGLETALHHAFAQQRVNTINAHREFFYVTPEEVKARLSNLQGDLLSFTVEPEALEWRQSEAARRAQAPTTTLSTIPTASPANPMPALP
jgi:hypothetical protein